VTQRKLILVLGMHRSGTSLLSGLLAHAGVSLGEHIMPPAEDNPAGFWENQSVVGLNERLLNSFDLSWSSYAPLPSGWLESEPAKHYCSSLEQLLEDEFGETPLIAIKDPRLCRLLPLWRTLDDATQLHCVSIVRPARDVSQSLKQRDGIGQAHGLALWLRYNLDWLQHCEGLPLLRCNYAAVLANPVDTIRGIATLCGEDLQLDDPGFADVRLQHQNHERSQDWTDDLYQALADNDTPVSPLYSSAVLPFAARVADLQLDAATRAVSTDSLGEDALQSAREAVLFDQAQDARRYATSLEQELAVGRHYVANMEQEIAVRDKDIAEKLNFIRSLEDERSTLLADLEERERYITDMRQELDTRETYSGNLEREIAARDDDIAEKLVFIRSLESERGKLLADLDEREGYVASLKASLQSSEAAMAEALKQGEESRRASDVYVASLQAAISDKEAELSAAASTHAEHVARNEEYVQTLLEDLARKDAYGSELEQEAQRLREELGQVSAQLQEELHRFRQLRRLDNWIKGTIHSDD
jgi:hypothetical protein